MIKDKLTKEYAIDYYLNEKIFVEDYIGCHCQSSQSLYCTCKDKGPYKHEISKDYKIKYIKCCENYNVLFENFSENKAYITYKFSYVIYDKNINIICPIVLDY
jgi:hypothetical protein